MNGSGYAEVAGGRLHYWTAGMGASTIVWVHGLPLNGAAWRRQLEHFKDHRNVAVDLRGYGLSSAIPSDVDSVTDLYVDDLERLLAHIGEERAIFVGHASGGHCVLRLAAQRPNKVARAVLINASPRFRRGADWPWGFDEEAVARFNSLLTTKDLKEAIDALMAFDTVFKEVCGEEDRQAAAELIEIGSSAHKDTLAAFFDNISRDDDRVLLPSVHAPTLLLTSPLDREVPMEVGLYMRRAIPHAQLVELPDSDHFSFATRPRASNLLIEGFLRQSIGERPQ